MELNEQQDEQEWCYEGNNDNKRTIFPSTRATFSMRKKIANDRKLLKRFDRCIAVITLC